MAILITGYGANACGALFQKSTDELPARMIFPLLVSSAVYDAVRLSGVAPETSTLQVIFSFLYTAVIRHFPGFIARTRPLSSTEAMLRSEDDQAGVTSGLFSVSVIWRPLTISSDSVVIASGFTVRRHTYFFPPALATILHFPAVFVLTIPRFVTVATSGSDEDQEIVPDAFLAISFTF